MLSHLALPRALRVALALAVHINRSLTALGTVFHQLATRRTLTKQRRFGEADKVCVVYRASKLTELLQQALKADTGNTLMFVNVRSVADDGRPCDEETLNSLEFAANAAGTRAKTPANAPGKMPAKRA